MEDLLTPEEYEATRRRLEEMYHEEVRARKIRAIRVNSGYRWQPKLYIEVGRHCGHLTPDGPPREDNGDL